MVCPKCKSDDVTVQMETVSSRTSKKGNGLLGHVNNTARAITAFSTLGMSNLVWKKSKGTETTKMKNAKICICQDCGYAWNIR